DFATDLGFKKVLCALMELKEGGVIWFSPPYCGDPQENDIQNVAEAKREEYLDTAKVCFLGVVAVRRKVTVIVECARDSWFWKYGPWMTMVESHGMYCSDVVFCAYSDDAPYDTFQHRIRLMGTEWWVGLLGSKCTHGEGVHPRARLCWFNEVYPPKFCQCVVETYKKFARVEPLDPGPVPYAEALSQSGVDADFSLGMGFLGVERPRKLARTDSAVSERLSAPLDGLSESDKEPDSIGGDGAKIEDQAFFMTSTPQRDSNGKYTKESMDKFVDEQKAIQASLEQEEMDRKLAMRMQQQEVRDTLKADIARASEGAAASSIRVEEVDSPPIAEIDTAIAVDEPVKHV
ncbi:unnamed protein product, partial [Prorocentrum cordatum]